MRFLKRLSRRKEAQPAVEAEVSEDKCPHVALIPRWDSPSDMGKPDRVSSYFCEGCKGTFSREEGERLQASEAERLRRLAGERLDDQ